MLKPGQLFTVDGNVFRVTKNAYKPVCACASCLLHYKTHSKKPCWNMLDVSTCITYCGPNYFPKLVKLCGNQDKQ